MYLFAVVVPLAIQAVVAHAVPPGLPTNGAYQREVGHDALLTISTVGVTPAARIHNRDKAPGVIGATVAQDTAAHCIPLMPPYNLPCATTTVTHTTTIPEPLTTIPDSTTTKITTITRTRTSTLFIEGVATAHPNATRTNNAPLNGTMPYNSLSMNLTASSDNKCGVKVGKTCIGSKEGRCCSEYGYCGGTDAHCGAGCQGRYGVCGAQGLVDENSKESQ